MPLRWRDIARAESCSLVTDLDGTLVPLRTHPSLAFPTEEVIRTLDHLSKLPRTLVMVASGRPKADLEKWFGPCEDIELVAEHGLWIREGGAWRMTDHTPAAPLDDLAAELDAVASAFSGSRIERKTRGVGMHYRSVAQDQKPELIARTAQIVDRVVAAHPYLARLDGHELIEVRVAGVTKAKAVHLARKALGEATRIIALGDDVTDEDMFRELGPIDLGILIGPAHHPTAATLRLPDPAAAISLIGELLELRSQVTSSTEA